MLSLFVQFLTLVKSRLRLLRQTPVHFFTAGRVRFPTQRPVDQTNFLETVLVLTVPFSYHLVAASQVVVAADARLVVAHRSCRLVDRFLYGVEGLEFAGRVRGLARPLGSFAEALHFRLDLRDFLALSCCVFVIVYDCLRRLRGRLLPRRQLTA